MIRSSIDVSAVWVRTWAERRRRTCNGELRWYLKQACVLTLPDYQRNHQTGNIAARAVPICSVITASACLGAAGSHLAAKTAATGTCPTMRSCQI
jgi:hypothetical protein